MFNPPQNCNENAMEVMHTSEHSNNNNSGCAVTAGSAAATVVAAPENIDDPFPYDDLGLIETDCKFTSVDVNQLIRDYAKPGACEPEDMNKYMDIGSAPMGDTNMIDLDMTDKRINGVTEQYSNMSTNTIEQHQLQQQQMQQQQYQQQQQQQYLNQQYQMSTQQADLTYNQQQQYQQQQSMFNSQQSAAGAQQHMMSSHLLPSCELGELMAGGDQLAAASPQQQLQQQQQQMYNNFQPQQCYQQQRQQQRRVFRCVWVNELVSASF